MLSDEKFCDRAMKFALLENISGKYYKLDDYKKLIEANQTDKDGNLIYLYATDKEGQYSFIKAAADKGYDVLMMDGELDTPFMSMLEQKTRSRDLCASMPMCSTILSKKKMPSNLNSPMSRKISPLLCLSRKFLLSISVNSM